jgi:small ligand-binding sensory domain FIST
VRWASAVSEERELPAAFEAVQVAAREQLGGQRPDLVLAFASPHHVPRLRELPGLVAERLGPRAFLGCSAAGVIGGGRELELRPGGRPALALVAATLPGVELTTFHLDGDDLPDLDRGPAAWHEALGVGPDPAPQLLLLCDPASFDPHDLLLGLDFAWPASPKLGGLASAGRQNLLLRDRQVHLSGAIGLALAGDVVLDPLVAQGCRPIGPVFTVTACRHNLLLELDGRPPVTVLHELFDALSEPERELFHQALHIGISPSSLGEAREFLVRNVLGADSQEGILAVGALLRSGQSVQFQVRDAQAAAEDLAQHLARYRAAARGTAPAGALLFSCTGRGEHLYGEADHDSRAFQDALGPLPLGGFFCGGEIGPVGDSTWLHGYTSAFALFRPARPAP